MKHMLKDIKTSIALYNYSDVTCMQIQPKTNNYKRNRFRQPQKPIVMKIPKLLTTSRNTEVNAVTGRISTAFHESSLSADTVLTAIFAEIDPKNEELTSLIKRMKAESELETKDGIRDQAYQALYHYVFGLTFSTTETTKTAAEKVFALLAHYGLAIVYDNYDMETSELDSLLLDLATAKIKAAVDSLDGCAALIANVQAAQDDFKAARLAFQEEQANEGLVGNATTLKREVTALVNDKLIPVLQGLVITIPGTYSKYCAAVVKIITTNNETVKKRSPKDKEIIVGETKE